MFAAARACHQPIKRNDIIPTPSQPMNSCSILLAVTRITIVIRNSRRYLINLFRLGSEAMYHSAKSIIAQVMKRATGKNMVE